MTTASNRRPPSARSDASATERSLARWIISAWSSSRRRWPAPDVSVIILARASSWRIMTAGMPWPAWRIFSNARCTSRSYPGWAAMTLTYPWLSRWTRAGCQCRRILHRLSPSQSMHVRAVKVSLTAGERARMAISTSWSMPNETSWVRVRYGPVMWERPSTSPTWAAAAGGHTVATGPLHDEVAGPVAEADDRILVRGEADQVVQADELHVAARRRPHW